MNWNRLLPISGLIVSTLSFLPALSQTWQPIPTSDIFQLTAIAEPEPSLLYATGGGGEFYRSRDTGATWQLQGTLPGFNETGSALEFHSPDTGYLGGITGTIWRTENAGRDWTLLRSEFHLPWRQLAFFNRKSGLGLNQDYLIRTTDGWASWEYVRRGVDQVQVTGPGSGVLLSYDSLFASHDSGRTWAALPWTSLAGGGIHSFKFLDPAHGFLMARRPEPNRSALYKTSDSGSHWSLIREFNRDSGTSRTAPPYAHLEFRDSLNGFSWEIQPADSAGPGSSFLARTGDGGLNWTAIAPLERWESDAVFKPSGRGFWWILDRAGFLHRGKDNGSDWSLVNGGPKRYFNYVFFVDRLHGFGTAEEIPSDVPFKALKLFRTTDGGRSWRMHPDAKAFSPTDLQFTDSRHGFAYGDDCFLRTVDGGIHWSALPTGAVSPVQLAFADSLHGLGANGNTVSLTSDGGSTWRRLAWGANDRQSLFHIAMADPQTLYLSGNLVDYGSSNNLVSKDAGKTWRPFALGGIPYATITTMAFPAPGIHYAVEEGGSFFASRNSGATWTEGPIIDTSVTFFGLPLFRFTNPDTGILVGRNGLLRWTYDGGRHWEVSQPLEANNLVWVDCPAGSPAWVMAVDGRIWERSSTTVLSSKGCAPLPNQAGLAWKEGTMRFQLDRKSPLQSRSWDARGRSLPGRIKAHDDSWPSK